MKASPVSVCGGVAVALGVVKSGRSGDRSVPIVSGAPGRFRFLVFAVLLGAYYWALLTSGNRHLFPVVPLGMVFNSMAEHLVHGSFEVDPAAIDFERFVRDGKTYAYWGVFCAAIRMPLLLIPGGIGTDITALSSLTAIMVAVWFKLRCLSIVATMVPDGRDKRFLIAICTAAVLLSGAQTAFMRLSIYQEICFWAGALASGFVYGALRCLLEDRYPAVRLTWMAILAGLAFNARVSTGIGLYAALGLLMARLLLIPRPEAGGSFTRRLAGLAAPASVLAAFAIAAGVVNYERWGNPLVFVDFHYYGIYAEAPHADNPVRLYTYGAFNIQRIPFGLLYYFLPIWIVPRGDQAYFFQDWQHRLIEVTELPPSSFLLTDPLSGILLCCLIWHLISARGRSIVPFGNTTLLLAGLTVPALLMMCAIAMCYRYRIEFYPLFDLGWFLGLYTVLANRQDRPMPGRLRFAFLAAMIVGIVGSHAATAVYKISPLGSALRTMPDGVFEGYKSLAASRAGAMGGGGVAPGR
jgi:hypothetical protein